MGDGGLRRLKGLEISQFLLQQGDLGQALRQLGLPGQELFRRAGRRRRRK